ncbi:MAG: hypothetical protein BGO34_02215 [Bacteroidia bacterium 44-10]|nr:MAG: hypothetical protein BGO34_02215 [Bacteroidia bacterium 44-10]
MILRLDDFCFLKAGQFISAKDINQEYDPHLNPCYGGNGLRGYVKTHTHEGEFSLIGRQGALCGNVNYVSGRFYATEHAIVVQCFASLNSKWLYYILEVMNLNQYSAGAAQPGLNVSLLNQLYISIPPRKEQDRIVERIENAFVFIDIIEINRQNLFQLVNTAKSKILDLAIGGKLVPQDPNDEAASVLLERIKSEHPERKKKPSKTSDNSHYENLPLGWTECLLGNIGNWASGATPNRSNISYYNHGTINWLKTGDLNDRDITDIPEKITIKALEECSLRLNPIGSVLIAMYGATIGKIGILATPSTTNQACCACITYSGIDNKFLFYLLMSQKNNLRMKAEGGAQPNISKEKIINYRIALPPYNEQIRIVLKIHKLFNKLDEIIEML